MRLRVGTILVALLVGLVGAPGSGSARGQPTGLPERIVDVDGNVVWLGSRAIASRTPADDPEIPLWLRERLDGEVSATRKRRHIDDCFDYGQRVGISLPVGATIPVGFDAIIRRTHSVFSGTVRAAESGLSGSTPDVLLLVDVDIWFKRKAEIPSAPQVYVRISTAHVNILGVEICRPDQRHLPRTPRPGDRLIVTKYGDLQPTAGSVPLLYSGPNIVFEHHGRIWTSDRMFGDAPEKLRQSTLASLEDRVRKIVDAGGIEVLASAEPDRADETPPVAPALAPGLRRIDCVLTTACSFTPILLSLDGMDVLTSGARPGEAVDFDINGDGDDERIAWSLRMPAYPFLWIDLNGNGEVDGAEELLGSAGTDPRGDAARGTNGFELLALYDEPRFGGNGDGRIDRIDAIWSRLRLWSDDNHDGVSARREVSKVRRYRVARFDTSAESVRERDGSGNLVLGRGRFWVRGPGGDLRARHAARVAFQFQRD